MSAYEETWNLVNDQGWLTVVLPDTKWSAGNVVRFIHGGATDAQMRLAAAAPEMARLLREFLNLRCDGDWCGGCAGCRHPTPGHHSDGCKLAAVLRKAGVPTDE